MSRNRNTYYIEETHNLFVIQQNRIDELENIINH
jgi:hypothetical protein